MTNRPYGLSLFQARKTDQHVHQHSHLHNRKPAVSHAHSHADFHNRGAQIAELAPRGSAITQVVQTVQVVQVVDAHGATLSAQTVTGRTFTTLVDSETGSTLGAHVKAAVTTSSDPTTPTDAPAITSVDPVSATGVPVSSTDSAVSSAVQLSVPAELSLTHISSLPFTTRSTNSNSTTSLLSSTSFASSSSAPSLAPTSLSTSVFSTVGTDFATSTPLQPSLLTAFSSNPASTTFASSTISSTPSSIYSSIASSGEPSTAGWHSAASSVGGGSGASPTDVGTAPGPAADESSDNSTASSGRVAGGIVGGIAGLALLLGLVFMFLRMRKRGWCHQRLGDGADEPDAAARQALPASGTGAGGGGGGASESGGATEANSAYGTMQNRSAPAAISASLAALTGKRNSRERAGSGPEMAERGFVRVSGKKLPPVLQYGGDGYSDPRENRASHISDSTASNYRDSIAVFDQPDHRPLALGSPMRPESGIMTMHPSPAKTPVTTQAPKAIESPTLPRASTFPSTDPLGRTLGNEAFSRETIARQLVARDQGREGAASRGSHHSRGSTRFTEHVE